MNMENILNVGIKLEHDPGFMVFEVSLDEETIQKSNKSTTDLADVLDANPSQASTKEENSEQDHRKYAEVVSTGQTNEFISKELAKNSLKMM